MSPSLGVVRHPPNIVGEDWMKTKMVPLRNLLALLGALFVLNSCGGSSPGCPVCGTQKNGPIGLIDVMLVPEHNPNGEPGGPFNISTSAGWIPPLALTPCRIASASMFPCSARLATSPCGQSGGDNSHCRGGRQCQLLLGRYLDDSHSRRNHSTHYHRAGQLHALWVQDQYLPPSGILLVPTAISAAF